MADNEAKETVSWDDLQGVDPFETRIVDCPNLSKIAGKAVRVKVRGIDASDLLSAAHFPLDEIRALTATDADDQRYETAWKEHVSTMGVDDLTDMMESVVRVGMVEPDPAKGDVSVFRKDYDTIFRAILEMTMDGDAVESASEFRGDGERKGG